MPQIPLESLVFECQEVVHVVLESTQQVNKTGEFDNVAGVSASHHAKGVCVLL